MADLATLEEMKFDRLFYWKKEFARFLACGLPYEIVETHFADKLVDCFLKTDFSKVPQRAFCVICKKALRSLWEELRQESQTHFITDAVSDKDDAVVEDVMLSSGLRQQVGDDFLEKWDALLEMVFPKEKDARDREIARKNFFGGETFQKIADDLGLKSRQAVDRRIKSIRSRIRSFVLEHRDRIYLHFDIVTADNIIEFARA